MKIDDIEIDWIKLKCNFIMSNGEKVKNKLINSNFLSDITITKIFDDLAKISIKKIKELKND